MYNPYMPNSYPQQGNFQQNFLPQQNVIQVNGKASVDSMRMAPNSSVLLMDSTAPMVWLCVSDGIGNITSTGYDIAVHKETPPVDTVSIETRLTNLENALAKMEERKNGKPDDARSNGKQNSTH